MAAPMSSENMSNPNSDKESDETNLLSPNFNPLKALYSPNVQLPFPQATIFNNLWEYEKVISSQGARRKVNPGGHGGGGQLSQTQTQRDSQPSVSKASDRKQRGKRSVPQGTGFRATEDMLIDSHQYKPRVFRNVITRMSEIALGPHSVLYRCMNERCKVRVCTRSFKGLRGICTGYVVTFDKFFNMALVDVDEVWRRPSTGQRFYHEEKLTFCKIMECSRMEEPQLLQLDKSKTKHTGEDGPSIARTNTSNKQPQATPKCWRSRSGEGSSSTSRHRDRPSAKVRQSDSELDHGDSQEHRRKDCISQGQQRLSKEDGDGQGQRSTLKKSTATGERADRRASKEEVDEDIEDLQKKLAALQQELTTLSSDDAEGSPQSIKVEAEGKENPETRLANLYRELTSLSDDDKEGSLKGKPNTAEDKALETRTEGADSPSSNSQQTQSTPAVGSVVTGQDVGQDAIGDSSKVTCTANKADTGVKRGRLKIKSEEFQRRHVNQLFIRGDNVVLVSVDTAILPK